MPQMGPRYNRTTTILVYGAAVVLVGVLTFLIFALAASNQRYDRLFTEYAKVTADCQEAADCVTTAPDPEVIVKEGTPGLPGNPGSPGEQGEKGEKGDTGEMGPRGFQGDPGPAGVDGEPGSNGSNGANGTNGADGTPGSNGAPGSDGPAGPAGPAGPPGANGSNGSDGRGIASTECVQIDILTTAIRFNYTDGTHDDVVAPCVP